MPQLRRSFANTGFASAGPFDLMRVRTGYSAPDAPLPSGVATISLKYRWRPWFAAGPAGC
jgi:hypothetical protein